MFLVLMYLLFANIDACFLLSILCGFSHKKRVCAESAKISRSSCRNELRCIIKSLENFAKRFVDVLLLKRYH